MAFATGTGKGPPWGRPRRASAFLTDKSVALAVQQELGLDVLRSARAAPARDSFGGREHCVLEARLWLRMQEAPKPLKGFLQKRGPKGA